MTSFYSLQCWNGIFFEDSSLHVLGQQVNLGHEGLPCSCPLAEVHNFTVVDVSGIHSVHLCYCRCQSAPEWCIQLLWHGWFPASMKSPETAFTFDFLNTSHLLNLQSKTTLYNFWLAIYHKSDNVGTKELMVCSYLCLITFYLLLIQDHYDQLLPAAQIWWHIKLTKQAGHSHNPTGVSSTGQGECVVGCPGCPHPGKNLPEGWDKAPVSIR